MKSNQIVVRDEMNEQKKVQNIAPLRNLPNQSNEDRVERLRKAVINEKEFNDSPRLPYPSDLNDSEDKPKKNKKVLTLFIVQIFSLLMSIAAFIPGNNYKLFIIIVSMVGQFVVLKNILDDYYDNF